MSSAAKPIWTATESGYVGTGWAAGHDVRLAKTGKNWFLTIDGVAHDLGRRASFDTAERILNDGTALPAVFDALKSFAGSLQHAYSMFSEAMQTRDPAETILLSTPGAPRLPLGFGWGNTGA